MNSQYVSDVFAATELVIVFVYWKTLLSDLIEHSDCGIFLNLNACLLSSKQITIFKMQA